jgi:hypothetical protein
MGKFDFNEQIENQKQKAINDTREWLRGWEPDQREMVLWILEEEVRNDKLSAESVQNENGEGTLESE